jgi:hypothetical protein
MGRHLFLDGGFFYARPRLKKNQEVIFPTFRFCSWYVYPSQNSRGVARKKQGGGGGMLVDMQELMTYEDVSRLAKFKISTLRKWVQLRKIPFVKINGAIRFNPEAIRAWATGQQGVKKSGATDKTGNLFPEREGADDGH